MRLSQWAGTRPKPSSLGSIRFGAAVDFYFLVADEAWMESLELWSGHWDIQKSHPIQDAPT